MCLSCTTTMRESPGQKTHCFTSYTPRERKRDHQLLVDGGRARLAEVHRTDCEAALGKRFKVAQQLQYYAVRYGTHRTPRARLAPRRLFVAPVPQNVVAPAPAASQPIFEREEVFTDEDAADDQLSSGDEDVSPPPAAAVFASGPTTGQLRAQQWRSEAHAACHVWSLDSGNKFRNHAMSL